MRHGLATLQRQALKGVPDGVAQVEGFALALLVGVAGDDIQFDLYRAAQAFQQVVMVDGRSEIMVQQAEELAAVAQHSVLEHLGKSRLDFGHGQRIEEAGRDNDITGGSECADFVFKATKIDARLAAHSGIDGP